MDRTVRGIPFGRTVVYHSKSISKTSNDEQTPNDELEFLFAQ